MMLHFLLSLLLVCALYAQDELWIDNDPWYEKVYPSVELGMHLSNFEGTISNIHSTTDLIKDLKYIDTQSSYIALALETDYDYIPNLKINYFSDTQNTNAEHNKTLYIADGVFDTNNSLASKIHYSVLNMLIYHSFKQKGGSVDFLHWSFYPGDIEYYFGLNLKIIQWRIDLVHPTAKTEHWINVKKNIPLPYFGLQYFYHNLRVYANVSALSFSDAKSVNYEYGLAYQVYNNLYIQGSYLYEDFQVTESAGGHIDTVKFRTLGNKLSVKYIF